MQTTDYAKSLSPDNPTVHELRGDILQSLLRLAEAAKEYRLALQQKPDSAHAATNSAFTEDLLKAAEGKAPNKHLIGELHAELLRQKRTAEALAMTKHLSAGDDFSMMLPSWKAQLDRAYPSRKANIEVRDHLLCVVVSGKDFEHLEGLRGIPCQAIKAYRSRVSDLSPVRDMPLVDIDISETFVRDLGPLKGKSLRSLGAYRCPIESLAPLRDMPLKILSIGLTNIANLQEIQAVPLQELYIFEMPVTDITPLKGMSLKILQAHGTRITDISILRGMPLEELTLERTKVTDIESLRGMPLRILTLHYTNVRLLKPLMDCPTLEDLTIPDEAQDVEVLRSHPGLQRLSFSDKMGKSIKGYDTAGQTVAEFWKAYDEKKAAGAK